MSKNTEDPLFDPWGPSFAADSWSEKGVPDRPVRPVEPAQRSSAASETVGRWRPLEKGPTRLVRPAPRARRPELTSTEVGSLLLARALPQLRALAQRLEHARHEAVIDDRTGHAVPSIRFLLRPWKGPFDAPSDQTLPVLELVDEGDGGIVVRQWEDHRAPAPSREESIPAERLSSGLRRVFAEYVEAVLSA